ncbi:hypothetical protein CYMTET_11427 [Cymbomonas tetramitiformis]|uniref:Uncharacterized protein n=1 Tax=Cymbomonas tetramitiformis TaxID=36881 RepID=A0AAE0GM50_9CHLO|nr:hypothetical protein CYMTET_11427 [Cymbomonas tetramitiformis]
MVNHKYKGNQWGVLDDKTYEALRSFCEEQRQAPTPRRLVPQSLWGGGRLRSCDITVLEPNHAQQQIAREAAAKDWALMFDFLHQTGYSPLVDTVAFSTSYRAPVKATDSVK